MRRILYFLYLLFLLYFFLKNIKKENIINYFIRILFFTILVPKVVIQIFSYFLFHAFVTIFFIWFFFWLIFGVILRKEQFYIYIWLVALFRIIISLIGINLQFFGTLIVIFFLLFYFRFKPLFSLILEITPPKVKIYSNIIWYITERLRMLSNGWRLRIKGESTGLIKYITIWQTPPQLPQQQLCGINLRAELQNVGRVSGRFISRIKPTNENWGVGILREERVLTCVWIDEEIRSIDQEFLDHEGIPLNTDLVDSISVKVNGLANFVL